MFTKRKFLIPLSISLLIAAFFTGTQPLRPEMALVSSVFVILFSLPSYLAITRSKGWSRGLSILVVLGFYALFIESLAINTGFPYGNFIYNDLLGQKIFGLTPWTVAFAWPPIILLTYWFARIRHGVEEKWKILFSTAFDAMLIDLVLDPAAVALGFWNWEKPGFFYAVPIVNFLGWLLTGFIGALILHWLWGKKDAPTALSYSGLTILWFWTWVNVFLVHVIPAGIGFGLLCLFMRRLNR